jgi:hypothetical protein
MQLPGPVRAVVGLFATAAEEAKNLPDRAIELPMLAVSTAMQMSLRAQQRYARLAARGDEILNRRGTTDDPPPWATFDEPVSVDTLLGVSGPADADAAAAGAGNGRPASEGLSRNGAAKKAAPAKRVAAPVKKAAAQRPAAGEVRADQTTTDQTTTDQATTDQTTADQTTADRTTTVKAAAKKNPAKKTTPRGKSVSRPRHTAPSRFDAVDDE